MALVFLKRIAPLNDECLVTVFGIAIRKQMLFGIAKYMIMIIPSFYEILYH